MQTALILVDLQNDFMPGGALAVNGGDELVAYANEQIAHYDICVATQDFHPRDHASFASNHPAKQVYDLIEVEGLEQVLWPDHCVQGTPGAEFHANLHTKAITKVFPKGTNPRVDSYSGFFDNGKRFDTGLATWLRDHNIAAIDVMGLATDYCVKATAIDGAQLGFHTRLLQAGCRAVGLHAEDEQHAIAAMQAAGVIIT